MSKLELVRVRDVMKVEFDMVDGLATVADALRDEKHRHQGAGGTKAQRRGRIRDRRTRTSPQVCWPRTARQAGQCLRIMNKAVDRHRSGHGYPLLRACSERYRLNRAAVVENREVIGIVSYATS